MVYSVAVEWFSLFIIPYLYGGASREVMDGMYCGEVNIERIIDLLISEYEEYKWRQRQNPLSVLIQTILSQNTSTEWLTQLHALESGLFELDRY